MPICRTCTCSPSRAAASAHGCWRRRFDGPMWRRSIASCCGRRSGASRCISGVDSLGRARSWSGGADNRLNPADDVLLDVRIDGILSSWIPLRQLERMIAVGHDVQRRLGREVIQNRRELRGRTERVAAPLYEENRPLDLREMLVAAFRRPARRMQRIPEEHETRRRQQAILGGYLRRNASAHRFPADEQRAAGASDVAMDDADDGAVAGLERRTAVRNPTALFGIEEI